MSERSAVQNPMLKYAQEIGWEYVKPDDALSSRGGFFVSGQFAWMTIYLPELFPTHVRGTAMSSVFDTSRAIAVVAPLLAGWLVTRFGGIGNAAAVMSLIYVVGLIATPFAGQETKGKPLPT
jgi:MFS family permease